MLDPAECKQSGGDATPGLVTRVILVSTYSVALLSSNQLIYD